MRMTTTTAILLLATCFFLGIDCCYSQDPCSARFVNPKPNGDGMPSARVMA
ncbi:MAG: hypothetical protein JWQ49_2535 [Edaphobacter sp.]|nr:hypothetical protein [Edaphobacter sp.]